MNIRRLATGCVVGAVLWSNSDAVHAIGKGACLVCLMGLTIQILAPYITLTPTSQSLDETQLDFPMVEEHAES